MRTLRLLVVWLVGASLAWGEAEKPGSPRPADLLDPRDFPLGATVVGPAPAIDPAAPVVRISVDRRESPRTTSAPRFETPIDGAPVLLIWDRGVELRAPWPTPLGPHLTKLLEKFLIAERVATYSLNPPLAPFGWVPTAAYESGDPEHPYPWNPATFRGASPFPPWEPRGDYNSATDKRNWSPTRWSRPIFDPIWKPTDSWGRTFPLLDDPRQQPPADAAADKVPEPPPAVAETPQQP